MFPTTFIIVVGFVGSALTIYEFVTSKIGNTPKRSQRLAIVFAAITMVLILISVIFSNFLSTQVVSGPVTVPTSSVTTPSTGASVTPSSTQAVPTQAPTPTPPPVGTVLYQADSSWSGWSGSKDWHIANGMLVNDGTAEGGGPTIVAPYQASVSDYAVEANIQVVHWNTCCIAQFAMVVRATSTSNGWQGYSVGDDIASFAGPQYIAQASSSTGDYGSSLGTVPFDPGSASHLYRIEVKGNNIKLFIDRGLKRNVNNNTNLTGGQVGLWSFGVQLNISSFKITAL